MSVRPSSVTNDLDDLVVGSLKQNTMQEIARSEPAWNIINGFYSGRRPQTCHDCTLYQPIDHKWLERRTARAQNRDVPQT